MAKHTYRIEINGGITRVKPYTYQYGKYQEISLAIGRQKAVITFKMSVLKDIRDFIDMKVYPFKDAYRKAYLLHTLLYDTGMKISKIDIFIDHTKHTLDSSMPNFPFIYSMIRNREMGLTDAWKSKDMIDHFLGSTKTAIDTDMRSCAVMAFLAGKSRTYRTDRFLNFWTSINAYYSYIGDSFEKAYKKKNGLEEDEDVPNKYRMNHLDNPCIGALICTDIKKDCYIKKKYDSSKEFSEVCESTNKLLYTCTDGNIDALYEDALANLDNEIREGCPYNPLYEAAKKIEVPLFVYLLLLYPYRLRCNYFHGSKVQPVIAGYRDPEIFDLNIINRFLERFLTEKIPSMFEETEMSDEDLENIIRYCKYRDKH